MSYVSFSVDGPSMTISIDVPPDLMNSKEFEARLPEALAEAALEAGTFWESEAGRRLTLTRERYQRSIHVNQHGDDISITLEDPLAVAIDQGSSAFSLRPGFLASPKIKQGPVKIPRAVAASMPRTGQRAATKWMVIPLNVDRQNPFTSPKVFRTFTDKQPASKWMHPGFKGVHIAEDVVAELRDNILPKHVSNLIDEIYNKR